MFILCYKEYLLLIYAKNIHLYEQVTSNDLTDKKLKLFFFNNSLTLTLIPLIRLFTSYRSSLLTGQGKANYIKRR